MPDWRRVADPAGNVLSDRIASISREVKVSGNSPSADQPVAAAPRAPGRSPVLHLVLFLAALLSAVVAGGFLAGIDVLETRFAEIGGGAFPVPTRIRWSEFGAGLTFGLAFIGILLAHELGHYHLARRHHVGVSLPYFIPFPPYFSLVGTLGAFIRLRGPIPSRTVLFDIGVAGPVASFVLSLPLLAVGLHLSEVVASQDSATYPFQVLFLGEPVRLGTSILLRFATWAAVPGLETGQAILLHPLAFAGWLGIFVTALNLIPLGQLDGGHILYALAGPRQRSLAMVFILLLIPLGFVWWGWWLWAGVALGVGRGRVAHPPVQQEEVGLGTGRTVLGWAALAVFILSFSPAPLRL